MNRGEGQGQYPGPHPHVDGLRVARPAVRITRLRAIAMMLPDKPSRPRIHDPFAWMCTGRLFALISGDRRSIRVQETAHKAGRAASEAVHKGEHVASDALQAAGDALKDAGDKLKKR